MVNFWFKQAKRQRISGVLPRRPNPLLRLTFKNTVDAQRHIVDYIDGALVNFVVRVSAGTEWGLVAVRCPQGAAGSPERAAYLSSGR